MHGGDRQFYAPMRAAGRTARSVGEFATPHMEDDLVRIAFSTATDLQLELSSSMQQLSTPQVARGAEGTKHFSSGGVSFDYPSSWLMAYVRAAPPPPSRTCSQPRAVTHDSSYHCPTGSIGEGGCRLAGVCG